MLTGDCRSPKITFRWIPGHHGIEDNEMADEEAKKAASGDSSTTHRLPELLRQQLPSSLAMVCKAFNQRTMEQWETQFRTSPHHRRLFPAQSNLTFKKIHMSLISLP
ncbi:hypothetical protein L218DRAFT_878495 [Marasmius fiardii PR-910]|nr:hypothetical protein L218DRAFT_878495 [Marasmius fiardii PR-910]